MQNKKDSRISLPLKVWDCLNRPIPILHIRLFGSLEGKKQGNS
jgi:hypothetical protein